MMGRSKTQKKQTLPLFDDAKIEAYRKIKERLPKSRGLVFSCLVEYGPLTDQEIAKILGWEINRVIPRRKELEKLGLVKKVGEKIGEYGNLRTVWDVEEKWWLMRLD